MKLNKKALLYVFLFLNGSLNIYAQETKIIQGLTIGQKCPDLHFNNIIHYSTDNLSLSQLKGKLVILDFWATWCSPCVAALQKLDTLQKEFAGKIMIIPITSESKQYVLEAFERYKSLQTVSLLSVTEDTLTGKHFKHRIIPHEIWINGEGTIIGITSDEYVTATNIEKYLNGYTLELPVKKEILDFNEKEPLLAGAIGSNSFDKNNILFSSVLTKSINGLPSYATGHFLTGNAEKIIAVNYLIQNLYKEAFINKPGLYLSPDNPDFYLDLHSRTRLEVSDSSLFYWPGENMDDWKKIPDSLKAFCYELIVPKHDTNKIYQYMLQDLNRIFGSLYNIEAVREKRKEKCWALVLTSDTNKIASVGGNPELKTDRVTYFHMRNNPIKKFMFYMVIYSLQNSTLPIIDETNYTQPMDLDFKCDLSNIEALRKQLQKYGLNFIQEEKEIDMIVIRNKK